MQVQVIILFLAHRSDKETHIGKPLIYAIHDDVGVSAVGVQLYVRIFFMKIGHYLCDGIHGDRFAAAYGNISAEVFGIRVQCRFSAFEELHDLAGAVAEEYTVLRQGDLSLTADKERLAELFFKIHHLL